MPAPPEFHIAFMTELAKALTPAIDQAWEAGQRAVRTGVILGRNASAPAKERAPRLKRGLARQAVMMAINAYDDKGASRQQIRHIIPNFTNGIEMSENTLKRVLMVLREKGKIETKNSRWWPTRMPAAERVPQGRPRPLRVDE
jgi:hypothetical protein